MAQEPERCDMECHSRAAARAATEGRHVDYLGHARSILALAPSHPGALHAVARGLALTGRTNEALAALRTLVAMGDARQISDDPAFATIRSRDEFASIEAAFLDNGTAHLPGRVVRTIPDADLIPESFVHDEVHERWLIGSQSRRKVIAMDEGGTISDFVAPADMLRVVGMHADTTRGLLWIASWEPRPDGDPLGGGVPSRTRLFKADLESGHVLARYAPSDSTADHLFNDLAVAPNGDVYITDSSTGKLFRIPTESDTLEVFLTPDPVQWTGANGIARSPDGRLLWVAYFGGIAVVDLATRRINWLAAPAGVSTAVIDGLYHVDGALVGVQAAPGLTRVVRFDLARDGRSIVGATVLERGGPLTTPTTGQVIGSRFYYIANGQYDRLGDDGTLHSPHGEPIPSAIRVVDLDPAR
jgi:hypothetical protein